MHAPIQFSRGKMARTLVGISLALLACTSLIPPTSAPPFAPGLGQPGAERWYVDSFHTPPVAGHRTSLIFEYVPPSQTRPEPIVDGSPAGPEIPLTAHCVSCAAPAVNGVAGRYDVRIPQDLAHADATAAYSAALTFPMPGKWRLDPFKAEIDVRALSAFEPPLIHVRSWSAPLSSECGREQVAALIKHFTAAYNTADAEQLAVIGESGFEFSIAGGALPVSASAPSAFVSAATDRSRRGERIEFTVAYLAAETGRFKTGLAVAAEAIRTAPDLPGGRQVLTGTASVSCDRSQPRFNRLNFGVRP